MNPQEEFKARIIDDLKQIIEDRKQDIERLERLKEDQKRDEAYLASLLGTDTPMKESRPVQERFFNKPTKDSVLIILDENPPDTLRVVDLKRIMKEGGGHLNENRNEKGEHYLKVSLKMNFDRGLITRSGKNPKNFDTEDAAFDDDDERVSLTEKGRAELPKKKW